MKPLAIIATPLGNLAIRFSSSQEAISEIRFTDDAVQETDNPRLLQAVKEVRDYFEGKSRKFDFSMKPAGTDFQQQVWQELQNIPYGTTISYQELANRLGDPKCIRAAASANGKNPIAIAIPCHRVIGADGSMTGYAGGLERKKALLRLEGAEIMSQIDLF